MSATGDTIFQPGHRWITKLFALEFSAAGNLELRDKFTARLRWQSGTSGGTKLAMQQDGNLVIYSATDKVLWATNTDGNPGAALRFQEDGNLVIYSAEGKSLWATATH